MHGRGLSVAEMQETRGILGPQAEARVQAMRREVLSKGGIFILCAAEVSFDEIQKTHEDLYGCTHPVGSIWMKSWRPYVAVGVIAITLASLTAYFLTADEENK